MDTVTLADDPDLAHLIDLIDILPPPDVTDFWGKGDQSIGRKFRYRLENILGGQGHVTDVDYLAVYVLKYLGQGNTYISEEQISQNLTGVAGLPAAGRAWVEDATRTAWALVTRYSLANWRGRRSPGHKWAQG